MKKELKIGSKIKERRLALGLTQKEVAKDRITRNMLSLIESGDAFPSVDTAEYLSEMLDLPLPYLFSSDESMFLYEKHEKMPRIKELYRKGSFKDCIDEIKKLSSTDDEVDLIYALSAMNYGKELLFKGSLSSAEELLSLSLRKAESTLYDTFAIKATAPLYLSVTRNIQSPLLEFDSETYEKIHINAFDYEFFKYITKDDDYIFENKMFGKHLEARRYIKKYNYYEAIAILTELEEARLSEYNACVLFGVYSDLESVYKQMGDFENAYRYSSKRMALINAFKS